MGNFNQAKQKWKGSEIGGGVGDFWISVDGVGVEKV